MASKKRLHHPRLPYDLQIKILHDALSLRTAVNRLHGIFAGLHDTQEHRAHPVIVTPDAPAGADAASFREHLRTVLTDAVYVEARGLGMIADRLIALTTPVALTTAGKPAKAVA